MAATIRTIFSLFLLMLSVAAEAVVCSQSDITLSTQSEVDSFQVNFGNGGVCDSIAHTLEIQGTDITNLDGLSDLISVGRGMSISDNEVLVSIAGLSNLTNVTGNLDIDGNRILPNLDGLSALKSVTGTLFIYNNESLININALSNLSNTGWNLVVVLNENLVDVAGLTGITSIGGSLQIESNDALTNLDGLSNLTNIEGSMLIRNSLALANLDGLSALSNVGSALIIQENQALENIEGLAELETVGHSLEFLNNPKLTNLDSLNNLSGDLFGDLRIEGNDSLTNLNGLAGITGVGNILFISGNNNLSHINGLSNITSVGMTIGVSNNDKLTNINGLASISGGLMSVLLIDSNDVLINLDGLEGITSIGGNLSVSYNETLSNIDGLKTLSRIGGWLTIEGNVALTEVNGLLALVAVGTVIRISDNPNLESCEGLIPLLDDIDDGDPGPGPGSDGIPDFDGGILQLFNNLEGCKSVESILASEASATININKIYSDDNPDSVTTSVSCDGPTTLLTAIDDSASFESPAEFVVRRFIPDYAPVCTAKEVVSPAGYSADESDCEIMILTDDATLECDIINTLNPIVVYITKSYENPQPGVDPEVAITLTCPTGKITPSATVVTSGGLATFEVSNFPFEGETCVVTEGLVRGYIQVNSDGCEDLFVSPRVSPEPTCTFLNSVDPESIYFHGFED